MKNKYQVIVKFIDENHITEELYDIVSWHIEDDFIFFVDVDGDVFSYNKKLIKKYTVFKSE